MTWSAAVLNDEVREVVNVAPRLIAFDEIVRAGRDLLCYHPTCCAGN